MPAAYRRMATSAPSGMPVAGLTTPIRITGKMQVSRLRRYYLLIHPIWLLVLMLFSLRLEADICRLETDEAVEITNKRLSGADMIVTVCGHCEKTDPVPLRIREIEFRHFAPATVSIPFYEETFPVEALDEAERKGSGALATALRAKVEKEYADETGYLPNDPYLISEKRARYRLLLRFAREDYEMRVWDELWINGRPANPALVYYPVGNDEYHSLGIEVDCDIYQGAPERVTYKPVARGSRQGRTPGSVYRRHHRPVLRRFLSRIAMDRPHGHALF